MTISLNKKSGAPVYHRNGETIPKNYSIFGDNGMMNYAYVSSDEDSDNQGHYIMPTKTPEHVNKEESKKNISLSNGKKDTDRPVMITKNKLSSKKVYRSTIKKRRLHLKTFIFLVCLALWRNQCFFDWYI